MSPLPAPSRSGATSSSPTSNDKSDAAPRFIRSSYCQGGLCLEAALDGNEVLLRDGKDLSIAPLRFSKEAWQQFLAQCRKA